MQSARFGQRCLTVLMVPVLLLPLAATNACRTVGPRTIPADRFRYTIRIAESKNEQLLLNLVRLRYAEAPVFLNLSSVINQYVLEGEVGVNVGVGGLTDGLGADVGGIGRWADRPTITYTPVEGQEFSRNLLTPLPPESLFSLLQAGWPVELVFQLTVQSVNGIQNALPGFSGRQQADPMFARILNALRRVRDARALGLKHVEESREPGQEDPGRVTLFFRNPETRGSVADDIAFLKEALSLDPKAEEYELVYGFLPEDPQKIAILTASMIDLLSDLAWQISVPPSHVEEGRTLSSFQHAPEMSLHSLLRVRWAAERPDSALVAVRNREHWFYVDDRDMESKTTFAFLQVLLALAETSQQAVGPVVSIGQ